MALPAAARCSRRENRPTRVFASLPASKEASRSFTIRESDASSSWVVSHTKLTSSGESNRTYVRRLKLTGGCIRPGRRGSRSGAGAQTGGAGSPGGGAGGPGRRKGNTGRYTGRYERSPRRDRIVRTVRSARRSERGKSGEGPVARVVGGWRRRRELTGWPRYSCQSWPPTTRACRRGGAIAGKGTRLGIC
jgi:hypothetical protein